MTETVRPTGPLRTWRWPLIAGALILIAGFVISPPMFVMVAVPLVIMVGIPTIVVLMIRNQSR